MSTTTERNKLCVLLLFSLLSIPSIVFGQSNTDKNEFSFGMQSEYRITPVYLSGFTNIITNPNVIIVDENNQISGSSIGLYLLHNYKQRKLKFQFTQVIRYDHVYFDTQTIIPTGQTINKSVNDWLTDFQLTVSKYHKLKNNNSIYLKIGYAFMNYGSSYSYTRQININPMNPIYITSYDDFNLSSFIGKFGYTFNDCSAEIGGYITDGHKYDDPSQLFIPSLTLSYNILKIN